ncbi:hypothetical protein AAGG49_18785 [Stenotrophomonas maltophilia]|uniref:hypothetical protein n=1 Tax=Stenotrophomonas maltophilia TaxID=40324 RepID=UPI00313BC237
MKIKNDITNSKARDERLAKLQRKFDVALSMKAPSMETIFSEAYERIEGALEKGLSQKEVIAYVNEVCGLKLHAASFRKLLSAERELRGANGYPTLCPTCGSRTFSNGPIQPENASTEFDDNSQQQEAA